VLRRWFRDRKLRALAGRRWFQTVTRAGEGDRQFLIVLRESGRPIGLCGLYGIPPDGESAEVGILLGERDAWGQGYGPEALRLLLGFGRAELGLERVSLFVHATNLRAIRAYTKVGFTVERRVSAGRWLLGRGAEVLEMSCPLGAGVGVR